MDGTDRPGFLRRKLTIAPSTARRSCFEGLSKSHDGRPSEGDAMPHGYVERLIGSIRRECTDHLIVFSAEHLRRILTKYATYYNEVRTHVSLGKDAPCTRATERYGEIVVQSILGGLHHRYARI